VTNPQSSGPRLTEDEVREALRSAAPDLAKGGLRHVAEGIDLDAWVIDETWIARFATSEDTAASLHREVRLLAAIGSGLPIPVPEHTLMGGRDGGSPRFAVHRMLPGVSGERLRPDGSRWPAVAEQLADFLSVLHSTRLPVGIAAGLETDATVLPAEDLAAQTIRLADPPTLDGVPKGARDAVARFLAGLGASPPTPFDASEVVAHSDLKPEHLLLDLLGERIVGVIDWADVCLTPAEVDLSGPVIWLGPAFAAEVIERYEGSADDATLERAVFRARCGVIQWLNNSAHGLYDPPQALLHAQATAAFSPGPDEPGFG
jgi:aminoglycoside 2''-phosphotransferase